MMSVRVFSMAALIAASTLTWVLPAEAQSIRFREPAEFPPASFTGSQYVDSQGCIFVRAGVAGATTWVPRVTSSRQNLCGARPTFANGVPAGAGASAQAALPPGARLITIPPAAAGAAAAGTTVASSARPSAAAPAAAAPAAARARPSAAMNTPVNARMAPQPPVMAPRAGAPMRTVASIATAPTLNAAGQRATGTIAGQIATTTGRCGADVRCGPQTQDPVSRVNGTARRLGAPAIAQNRQAGAVLDPQTRIVPRHVAQAQANAADAGVVPPGYRPVWQDDRLNPYRAHGTVAGKAAMDLVWTQTVPRRLIDRRSGRDMTAFNPNLVYPYTDLATQVRAGVPVAERAAERAADRATVSTRGTQKAQPQPQRQVAAQPRVSTRATPPSAPKAVTGRFLQVGAFADPANAQRTIRRLQAAGLPVSIQRSSSKGKPVQVILAGPFANAAALSQGLTAARAAGFREAFARN